MTADQPNPSFPRRRVRLWRFRRHGGEHTPTNLRRPDDSNLVQDDGPHAQDSGYIPSPEDFLPTPPKPKGPLNRVPSSAAARPALFCFILFFIASAQAWQSASRGGWVSRKAAFSDGEWWRLFTALFTHADLGHLLSNTPLFIIFGWYLYAFFGWLAFPAGAILIGAIANAATIYFYSPSTHLLGASGMLYGMVALWLVLYVHFETDYTYWMRIFRATGVSLVLLFPTTFQPQTSYLAHASGFFTGLAFGFLLMPFIKVRTPPEEVPAPTLH